MVFKAKKFHIQARIESFRKKMFGKKKKQLPLAVYYRPIDSVRNVLKSMAGNRNIASRVAKTFSRMFR
ncbi:hypothetical protein HY992_01875 [Candidatus Micrarchaeota archaeon]|nr:hypothetical protein [Candidatus Micrarchaeota archaeon]